MFNAVDGGAGAGAVVPNSNSSAAIFFVLSQLILKCFLVEVFVGAVIDTFYRFVRC